MRVVINRLQSSYPAVCDICALIFCVTGKDSFILHTVAFHCGMYAMAMLPKRHFVWTTVGRIIITCLLCVSH